jgi:death-on-curing protein
MLDFDEVLEVHEQLIHKFGGAHGIRDKELLLSAISRPFQTFDMEELYPTLEAKASALLESLVTNHPFIDGNKRVGFTLYRLMLLSGSIDIDASMSDKYELISSIAEGNMTFDKILSWTMSHVQPAR